MNKRTALIIQIIGDLAIPLLGYFFWDWTILFILQFYIIENLFLLYFKYETIRQIKIIVLKKNQPIELKPLLKSIGIWVLEVILIHVLILIIEPNNSLMNEWWKFLSYEDLGIPQGIILLPLMFFASKMKMTQDVIVEINKLTSVDDLIHLKINSIFSWLSVGFWGLLIGINFLLDFNEGFNIPFILILLSLRSFQRG